MLFFLLVEIDAFKIRQTKFSLNGINESPHKGFISFFDYLLFMQKETRTDALSSSHRDLSPGKMTYLIELMTG
jgi:hypothetical protein